MSSFELCQLYLKEKLMTIHYSIGLEIENLMGLSFQKMFYLLSFDYRKHHIFLSFPISKHNKKSK